MVSAEIGPIERVETGVIEPLREACFIANAWLSKRLNLKTERSSIFTSASGGGVDTSAMIAQYKAISEALERWAYYYLMQIGHREAYGFDVEPSSSGMAAYPGLFRWQSRRRAKLEAEERYCIHYWWRGELDGEEASRETYKLVQIENPISSTKVVLVWRQYSEGRWAYGTAAGKTVQQAEQRARMEMEVSALTLQHHGPADMGTVQAIGNYGERQILYYSIPEGHAAFQRRLGQKPVGQSVSQPEKIIDCIIPGPWQQYATVWRVLYRMEPNPADVQDFLY